MAKVAFRQQSLIILSYRFLIIQEVSIQAMAEAASGISRVARRLVHGAAMTDEPEPPKRRVAEPRRQQV